MIPQRTVPFLFLSLVAFSLISTRHLSAAITTKPFGEVEGKPVTLYTLTNKNGMSVGIMNYGATVVDLVVPDRQGKLGDIALGFDSVEPYLKQTAYLGATIGRYGNRIASGSFSLNGKTYQLPKNNGPNSLHGGANGFDKQMWKATQLQGEPPSIEFTRTSPDGEEGYPGKLNVKVTFTVTEKNELRIAYEATADKPTIVNLTNHTYFNLAGAGNGTILGQMLTLHADAFTPVDATLIPTGEIKKVAGTPWDFESPKPIGKDLQAVGGNPVGYDHNFVLEKNASIAAEVFDPSSGRVMKVETDQPGIQFYTGNFLDGTLTGKGGKSYPQYAAFCLETQHYPDSPNRPNFPSTVLKPGETYKTWTVYAFSTK
jgi:aldose 1-epimerase